MERSIPDFNLEAHETILGPGTETHAPHKHEHEEIVIVVEGTAQTFMEGKTETVEAGSVIYFGSNQMHSLRNAGTTPCRYYVVELRGKEPWVTRSWCQRRMNTDDLEPGIKRLVVGHAAVAVGRRPGACGKTRGGRHVDRTLAEDSPGDAAAHRCGSNLGAVTLVARHGKIVHFQAHGLMDIDTGTFMRPDAIFRIASMTKPITGVAVMMMVEEGKIRLNDPVSKFIPEFKDTKVAVPRDSITPHPAGVPGAQPDFYLVPA